MNHDIRDEVESAVAYYRESMPQEIKALIGLASYDLWHGPIHWNPVDLMQTDGESESDEPFPFETACGKIAEYTDSIDDIRIESYYCDETGESDYESIDGTRGMIIRQLCGNALWLHLSR